ncbi:cytochrome c peroxidase [Gracilaria domingensis]|nr:cytochrome c peroxidase [Gracilaria domingensis]
MATRLLVARLAARALSTAVASTPASRISRVASSRTFEAAAAATRSTTALTCVAAVGLSASVAYAASPVDEPVGKEDIAGVAAAIHDILDNDDEDLGPTLVRLAWHASGTYDKESGSGGSEGATMRFKPESEHGANAGLDVARNALEPIKILFPNFT